MKAFLLVLLVLVAVNLAHSSEEDGRVHKRDVEEPPPEEAPANGRGNGGMNANERAHERAQGVPFQDGGDK